MTLFQAYLKGRTGQADYRVLRGPDTWLSSRFLKPRLSRTPLLHKAVLRVSHDNRRSPAPLGGNPDNLDLMQRSPLLNHIDGEF